MLAGLTPFAHSFILNLAQYLLKEAIVLIECKLEERDRLLAEELTSG